MALLAPRGRGVVSESAGGRKPKTITLVFGNVHRPLLLATFESLSARHLTNDLRRNRPTGRFFQAQIRNTLHGARISCFSRPRLRILWGSPCGGSSPPFRTIKKLSDYRRVSSAIPTRTPGDSPHPRLRALHGPLLRMRPESLAQPGAGSSPPFAPISVFAHSLFIQLLKSDLPGSTFSSDQAGHAR